jgi:hypothetical protein
MQKLDDNDEQSIPSVAAAASTLMYSKAYGVSGEELDDEDGSIDIADAATKLVYNEDGKEEEYNEDENEKKKEDSESEYSEYSDVITFDVDSDDEAMICFPKDKSKNRVYSTDGPQPPNLNLYPANERDEIWTAYKKKRKAFNDKNRKKRAKVARELLEGCDRKDNTIYKGCNVEFLRTMDEVESNRLMVNHTFSSRDIVYLRVAEEANLRSIVIKVNRSDNQQFVATGIDFYVRAFFTERDGWTVHAAVCRDDDDITSIPESFCVTALDVKTG